PRRRRSGAHLRRRAPGSGTGLRGGRADDVGGHRGTPRIGTSRTRVGAERGDRGEGGTLAHDRRRHRHRWPRGLLLRLRRGRHVHPDRLDRVCLLRRRPRGVAGRRGAATRTHQRARPVRPPHGGRPGLRPRGGNPPPLIGGRGGVVRRSARPGRTARLAHRGAQGHETRPPRPPQSRALHRPTRAQIQPPGHRVARGAREAMIEDLQLENLGVILEARIDLAPGLTAITGETGAGKTMLLTGLNLILGGKADAGAVRAGADSAVAESRIIPPAGHPALAVAADAGAVLDDDALLVVRTIVSGRSRASPRGRPVPQTSTAGGAAARGPVRRQRDLAALASAYREVGRAEEELQDWDAQAEHRERDVLALARALERIDAAEVEPGQQAALREESERLSNVEELRIAAGTAHEALSGDFESGAPGIAELLEAARSALDAARGFDPQLGQWADQLTEAGHVLSDLGVELSAYGTNLEADPARLEDVHARRALLAELSRDYAGEGAQDPDAAVLAYAERARARLAELTEPGQGRERLE